MILSNLLWTTFICAGDTCVTGFQTFYVNEGKFQLVRLQSDNKIERHWQLESVKTIQKPKIVYNCEKRHLKPNVAFYAIKIIILRNGSINCLWQDALKLSLMPDKIQI